MAREPTDFLLLLDLLNARYAVGRLFDDALAETGLTTADFALYTMIAVAGPLTPQTLSRWTGMPATTVSAKIRRLVSAGHGSKQRNDADGRSYTLTLSSAGLDMHARALELFVDAFERFASTLPQAVVDLRAALRTLAVSARQVSDADNAPRREDGSGTVPATIISEFASLVEAPIDHADARVDRSQRYRALFADQPPTRRRARRT